MLRGTVSSESNFPSRTLVLELQTGSVLFNTHHASAVLGTSRLAVLSGDAPFVILTSATHVLARSAIAPERAMWGRDFGLDSNRMADCGGSPSQKTELHFLLRVTI